MGSDMIESKAIEIRASKKLRRSNVEIKKLRRSNVEIRFWEQAKAILMLKDEVVRQELRHRSEIEKLKGDIEDIKTACVNELQRIAESRRPFKVVLGDDDEKR